MDPFPSSPDRPAEPPDARLLVASNRLPVALRRDDAGRWRREPGSGGLVTALEPVLSRRGGCWVGWPGVLEPDADGVAEVLSRETGDAPYALEPVPLTAEERDGFYLGFSNEILWPLCHGMAGRCNFDTRYWDAYRAVNRKFAAAIAGVAAPDDFVWVHDYHLVATGEELRRAGVSNRTGFFLHIPFPPVDVFEQLPWSREVLSSLLRYDGLGFQTRRDARNFRHCLEVLAPGSVRVGDGEVEIPSEGRVVGVGVHPVSIDLAVFRDGARTRTVERAALELRRSIGVEHVVLGVDRLDYTKGVPQKLRGLERALERHPELRGRVTLFQLVVPSRERIPEYRRMKEEIEGLVGRINGRFTRGGWAPVLYRFGTWEQSELLAFYRAADVALVTPLRDGMNLVSKEYVAASRDDGGVLVLSSFAGSADELGDGALRVNPHAVDEVADALHRACTMSAPERRARTATLRKQVEAHDVHRWVDGFLATHARAARRGGSVRPEAPALGRSRGVGGYGPLLLPPAAGGGSARRPRRHHPRSEVRPPPPGS